MTLKLIVLLVLSLPTVFAANCRVSLQSADNIMIENYDATAADVQSACQSASLKCLEDVEVIESMAGNDGLHCEQAFNGSDIANCGTELEKNGNQVIARFASQSRQVSAACRDSFKKCQNLKKVMIKLHVADSEDLNCHLMN